MKEQSINHFIKSPDHFPARANELLMSTYYMGDNVMHMELVFDIELDAHRLEKACQLILDYEPILGCAFITDRGRACWQRLKSGERKNFFMTPDKHEYDAFKGAQLDAHKYAQVRSCLLREARGDTLLIKMSHYAGDAAAFYDTVRALSGIYTKLAHDTNYQPEPNNGESRSVRQVLGSVPFYAYPKIALNFIREIVDTSYPAKSHNIELNDGPRAPQKYTYRILPKERCDAVKNYGRKRQATLNDMLVTAHFRALIAVGKWDNKSQLRITMTVDLRRYIEGGRCSRICNLLSYEYLNLGTDPGNTFDATLDRVKTLMKKRKSSWIGLNFLVYLAMARILPAEILRNISRETIARKIRQGNIPPGITNINVLAEDAVTFDRPPAEARIFASPVYPPLFSITIHSYRGALVITTGVLPETESIVERYLDSLISLLPC